MNRQVLLTVILIIFAAIFLGCGKLEMSMTCFVGASVILALVEEK